MGPGEMRMVDVPCCPACGGGGPVLHSGVRDRLHQVPGRWAFRRCDSCRTFWMDPRPADDDLHLCYPTRYFTHVVGDTDAPATPADGWKAFVRRRVLASPRFGYPLGASGRLGRVLVTVGPIRSRAVHRRDVLFPSWTPGGRLLDVGCGSGEHLALMRGYGWDVAGVENDEAAARAARERRNLRVWPSIGEAATSGERFDVVTMSHVLEHLPDPASFLRGCVRMLRDGGRLLALTPNGGSLGHRLYGSDWYALDPPRHLVILTPEGLRATLARVPELGWARIRTSARAAGKIARERERVRRSGRFGRDPLGRWPGAVKPAAFAVLESLACAASPAGEELELEAGRL